MALLYVSIALLLAGIGHGLYWHWAAGQIESRVADWRDEQRRKGFVIDYRGPLIGGYPTRFEARFSDPRIEAPNGWRWAGPEISGGSALWSPFTIGLRYPGRHEIGRAGLARGVEIDLARAATEIQLRTDGRVERAQSALHEGEIRNSGAGPVTFESLVVDLGPLVEAQDQRPQNLALQGEATGVQLPEIDRNPFGRRIERLSLDATLVGEIDGKDPRAALSAWRDADGFADLHALEAAWGPMALSAVGQLSLDHELRPKGKLDTRVRGLDQTLEALSGRKLIKPGVVVAAKIGLAILPSETDAEGRPVVPLPITLGDGLVYLNFGLGPIPLIRLAPVL